MINFPLTFSLDGYAAKVKEGEIFFFLNGINFPCDFNELFWEFFLSFWKRKNLKGGNFKWQRQV